MYSTLNDANTALINSGVVEWFDYESLDTVCFWMYQNDATPEQAAEHFDVA